MTTTAQNSSSTALEDIIAGGNLQAIIAALAAEGYSDANSVLCGSSGSGNYALGIAANHGHLDVCKYLVEERNANIDLRANDGATPLLLAARGGSVPVIKYLLSLGADINAADTGYLTPLSAAAVNGHSDAVQLFLTKCAPTTNVNNNSASSPPPPPSSSSASASQKQQQQQQHLDINAADPFGFTAAMRAATKGNATIIKILAKAGADVIAVNGEGASALYFAARDGHLAAVKALIAAKANVDGLPPAAAAASKSTKQEERASADASDIDVDKRMSRATRTSVCPFGPPIYAAAEKGHLEVVKALVEAGADMNLRCKASGATALYVAAEEGHQKVVKYLVSDAATTANANAINASLLATTTQTSCDKNPQTTLTITEEEAKADVNARNVQDSSPLFVACYKDYAEIVKTLLATGADASGRYAGGDCTCLYVACQNGHLKTVKVLLDYHKTMMMMAQQNQNQKNDDHDEEIGGRGGICLDAQVPSQGNMTALCVAAANNYYDIVKALVGAGADIFITTGGGGKKNNEDCLKIAKDRDHVKIVEFLVQAIGQQQKKKATR